MPRIGADLLEWEVGTVAEVEHLPLPLGQPLDLGPDREPVASRPGTLGPGLESPG